MYPRLNGAIGCNYGFNFLTHGTQLLALEHIFWADIIGSAFVYIKTDTENFQSLFVLQLKSKIAVIMAHMYKEQSKFSASNECVSLELL